MVCVLEGNAWRLGFGRKWKYMERNRRGNPPIITPKGHHMTAPSPTARELLEEASDALHDVIATLAMLTEPKSISATTSSVAYANCIQSGSAARAALARINKHLEG
jgi:hypothetical protein